jgi:hypothetical protein
MPKKFVHKKYLTGCYSEKKEMKKNHLAACSAKKKNKLDDLTIWSLNGTCL